MPRILIIAYGNPLRSDDGLAWRAADQLEGKFSPEEVEILRLHQLAPEQAETASHFECVVFVDAAHPHTNDRWEIRPGDVRIAPIRPGDSGSAEPPRLFHAISPESVLALASGLYKATPTAFTATVTGENFGHGEFLSPAVAGALPTLTGSIEALVRKILAREAFPVPESSKP
jgi:hydrogenase maturation protease